MTTMNAPDQIRLQRIEVEGLFGVYDHRIDLNLDDRVTLLHGPNGVGKTHTLGMIDSLLRKDTSYFLQVPCKRFRLTFAGSVLELAISSADREQHRGQLTLESGGNSETATVTLGSEADDIAGQVGFLERRTDKPGIWEDLRNGELLSEDEVLARHGSSKGHRSISRPEDVGWFDAFLRNTRSRFIEAQRLVQIHWAHPGRGLLRSQRGYPTTSTVLDRGREFREILGNAMADYGRQAQTLDQTFPQRLVAATDRFDNVELQRRMTALEDRTAQFEEIGILDEAEDETGHSFELHSTALDDTQARVMTLYVQDTERKLDALADLARRIRHLLDHVNGKYRHKQLRIDRDEGLVAEDDRSDRLPLDSLSSGEQHELVMHYDLLFRVPANTIVLIDEPELSLHVSWQKHFLPDLLEVAKLSTFDAIVATHSPYIIGERDDLMAGLGDPA
ncbi:MAG: AAA family ATPase [Thiotrichales bacterium]|nr:AAA family ATPase [Thiotrichales bacterium]MCY4285625.1 AAA family ATPase [Thiotrichales bacterium]